MKSPDYIKNVFINCPFDPQYMRLFRAIVFTVHSVGLRPSCALDTMRSESRINKLFRLIKQSKYGIHDISRAELDGNDLPRFNMPFELGLDIACKDICVGYRDKEHLILERVPYQYQKCLSDIASYDVHPHHNRTEEIIQIVSDWLRNEINRLDLPNGRQIYKDFKLFESDFREVKSKLPKSPSFADMSHSMAKWINEVRKKQKKKR